MIHFSIIRIKKYGKLNKCLILKLERFCFWLQELKILNCSFENSVYTSFKRLEIIKKKLKAISVKFIF